MGLNDVISKENKQSTKKPGKAKKEKVEKAYRSFLITDETSDLLKKVSLTLKIQGKENTTHNDILNEAFRLMAKKHKIDVD